MYGIKNYLNRGSLFAWNKMFKSKKKLATLMFYATDRCDSVCKHCFIWNKKPKNNLSKDKIIEIMQSRVVSKNTVVGLEGGEFLLHPEAYEIMQWLSENHPNYELLSNCVNPKRVIEAVKKYRPKRLFVSLDGGKDTVKFMRGVENGFDNVIEVIETLKHQLPISVMFTLTPYNTFEDMTLVGNLCKEMGVDMRVGIYNNMAYFDTVDKAHETAFGSKAMQQGVNCNVHNVPPIVKEFAENYDFLVLHDEWVKGHVKLNCFSILDSLVILPNGDVPICQNLSLKLGNVHNETIDNILNKKETQKLHKHYMYKCNGCWINFHRKYDVVLYRAIEKVLPKKIASLLMGNYQWCANKNLSYKNYLKSMENLSH